MLCQAIVGALMRPAPMQRAKKKIAYSIWSVHTIGIGILCKEPIIRHNLLPFPNAIAGDWVREYLVCIRADNGIGEIKTVLLFSTALPVFRGFYRRQTYMSTCDRLFILYMYYMNRYVPGKVCSTGTSSSLRFILIKFGQCLKDKSFFFLFSCMWLTTKFATRIKRC